jgi:TonB-linked SusC/RagA family outer membrane protein
VNYNYANKYYLTGTARYDGSSKFMKGHQWGIFPSFSAAWNPTEESFMEDQQIFDQLKPRIGYGLVGNQNIDDFAFRSLYRPSVNNGQVSYVSNDRRGTEDITWEKQRQFNIGVDMGFLNNRIRFTADAFFIKNKDLLMERSLPSTTGFSKAYENIGAIENKGVEFSLNTALIDSKDLQWNFSANLSADKNKITQLYGKNDVIYNVDGDRNIQKEGNLFLGESRNTIYIMKTGGIAQVIDMDRLNQIDWNGYKVNPGDLYPVDANDDKIIDQNDRVVIGSTDPKFYGGFATDVTWKNLTLNAVFNYSYGAKKLSPYYEGLITSVGNSAASVDLIDRWTPENTDAQFPRPTTGFDYNRFNASQMDFSVQKASFLRLSTLTLAYTFRNSVLDKLKLSNLRLYATGSNLFCLTDYNGYDPETGDWYPPTKMYVFGLNVSF